MSKMIEFLKRNAPPGIELKPEYGVFVIGNLCSAVVSVFAFLIQYATARSELFTYIGYERSLIEGARITPFHNLISIYFAGFIFVAVFMLGYAAYHYAYYRQGSMSIYLMKRLPNSNELHKRAWTVPCLAALATISVAIATIIFCFIIYFLATPKTCLPYINRR